MNNYVIMNKMLLGLCILDLKINFYGISLK